MKRTLLALLMLLSTPAFAGRPLGTDDAGTVGDRLCQLEAWRDKAKESRGWVVAPACGLGEFELGLEASRSRQAEGQTETAQSLALKWGPSALSYGPLSFGGKIWSGRARTSAAAEDESTGYRPVENGALLLGSWALQEDLALHLNLGLARDRVERRNARLGNLALSWNVDERVMLFGEAMYQQHAGTTQSTGIRLWAIPGKLGIDLTAARMAGVRDSASYTVGFGWYGVFGR
ncbi:hypothetical protein ACFONG_08690 [Uliginosibacterium paludis]|uniref:Transporter n=1 Tax=Uliginosibacterium paludis TaxID=1615952 RepID=A0ABV2CK77_9RHOO